jgi:hypothetical protein
MVPWPTAHHLNGALLVAASVAQRPWRQPISGGSPCRMIRRCPEDREAEPLSEKGERRYNSRLRTNRNR